MKDNKDRYNPYEDPTIQISEHIKSEDPEQLSGREGFNDVIKHFDHVNGFRSPKRLEHFPKSIRLIIRWIIIISMLFFLISLIRECVSNIVESI